MSSSIVVVLSHAVAIMSAAYGKPEQYAILEKVRQIFRKRAGGICTFRSLSRAFRIMDANHDHRLTFDEFKTGLCDMGARNYLGQHEWPKLFSIFDHDGSGTIDQAEFLLAVRGTLSAARRVLVDHAFSLMDKSCTGMINKQDIESRFRGHDVTLMMRALGDRDGDGFITPEEWRDYYASISANFDTDVGFNLMMRNAWHISGGVGAEANTTNKRVLVTRLDGSQTVEAIEEDLGLDLTDQRAVMAALKRQGIWDAVGFSVDGVPTGSYSSAMQTPREMAASAPEWGWPRQGEETERTLQRTPPGGYAQEGLLTGSRSASPPRRSAQQLANAAAGSTSARLDFQAARMNGHEPSTPAAPRSAWMPPPPPKQQANGGHVVPQQPSAPQYAGWQQPQPQPRRQQQPPPPSPPQWQWQPQPQPRPQPQLQPQPQQHQWAQPRDQVPTMRTAAQARSLVQSSGEIPPAKQYKMMETVRTALAARGGTTFRHLAREFRIMDDNRDQKLSFTEFHEGLTDLGLRHFGWTLAQWRGLFGLFDSDGSGHVDMTEFLKGVRGSLNADRRVFVDKAFAILDKSCTGTITMRDMQQTYKGEPEQIKCVMHAFGDKNHDGEITRDEWYDYYSGLSANFDTDQEFELMMRNAWHISGGVGAAANTSNTRVLVTHLNGSRTVECIENDLGLDMKDHNAVIQSLKKQGIWDAVAAERVSAM